MSDTVKIPLARSKTHSGEMAGHALIDEDDRELIEQYDWYRVDGVDTDYARTYEKRNGKWKIIIMHRLIMGNPKGKIVHHLNGEGLDNRKANLEVMSRGAHSDHHRKEREKEQE